MPEIVLHQWEISPFCGKIRKVLQHKGLTFSTVNYNGLRSARVAGLSKQGQLPVISYDGEVISDSARIASFLDQRHPEPALFPHDPLEKARAHFWEDWADEALYWFEIYFRFTYPDALNKAMAYITEGRPAWERPLLTVISRWMFPRKVRQQGLARRPRARVEAEFEEHLRHLDALLADGSSWLVGSQRTIADIAVSSQLDEVKRTSHLGARFDAYPHMSAWLARN